MTKNRCRNSCQNRHFRATVLEKTEWSLYTERKQDASVTINGKVYTAAELSMNSYGVTAMLWYPVQDTDAITVTVNGMTGVEDVFGHTLDTTSYQSNSIAGVTLKSVLMRNAPTARPADYDNGKALFTMNANMERVSACTFLH